ncbi:MAG: SDR family NAD(P)-dependent oxidoreductase [Solirubrobacteraceae bacterium]
METVDGVADRAELTIVTGAGSGIGRAVALRLARDGMLVLAADIDLVRAEQTAKDAGELVGGAQVDVSNEESVRELVAVAAHAGPIGALVNVAGVGSITNAPDTPLEVWERVMSVNATGTFLCCKHVIPHLRTRGSGAIVNIASIAGLVGMRDRAAYCASKGAVVALTRAIALDHAVEGIRVNAVCPGTVDTPWIERLLDETGATRERLAARQPMGRIASADEVAGAVAWLLSGEAAFATGSMLVLDGGWTAA